MNVSVSEGVRATSIGGGSGMGRWAITRVLIMWREVFTVCSAAFDPLVQFYVGAFAFAVWRASWSHLGQSHSVCQLGHLTSDSTYSTVIAVMRR